MAMIAEHGTTFIILAVIFGLLMAWGIGANDVANALGTSVGSGAITVGTAIIIAAIFEFLGAALAGGQVTATVRKGIIDPTPIVDNPELLVFGMLASLLAAAVWLAAASYRGWPVSTTHSIVGALFGFGIVGLGPAAVNWATIGQIVASWVISPVVGGLLAFAIMMSVQVLIMRPENSLEKAIKWTPVYAFLVGFIMTLVTLFKGLKHLDLELSLPMSFAVAALVGALVAAGGRFAVSRMKTGRQVGDQADTAGAEKYAEVEKIFTPLMIVTACAMAFAHGSNDVANGIGPLTAVLGIVRSGGDVGQTSPVPIWVLLLGGGGIVLGLVTYGYRVMRTIGTKITALTPSSGFCATMAAAATVVLASRTGMPVSTTHIAVGAVMGVGLARGFAALDLRVVGSIFASWIVTLPAGAILSALFYFTLKGIFT